MSPKRLTQDPLENLAGAALGQLGITEFDAAWNLVIGQRSPAVPDQIIGAERFAWLQDDASHHQFAPLWIGYSKYRCFTNRRMLVDNCFDLAAVNVLAAGDNHVLQAVQDVEIPI